MREGKLARRGELAGLEPAELDEVVCRAALAGRARDPRETQHDAGVVRLEPVADELRRLDLEPRFLPYLAPEPVERKLVLVEKAARKVPQPRCRIEGTASEQHPPELVDAHGFRAWHGVRVADVSTGVTLGAVLDPLDSLGADGTEAPTVQNTHELHLMSPRAAGATQHELSRIGLLATLPGETLARLAQRMTREDVPAGAGVISEGEEGDRFYVVLSGMLSVSQESRGPQAILRPGDYFGEVALAMHMPRTASVRALTPATVASCDQATFDEFIRPLFADDGD
jgi:Cyclic nucleotide-binding domain